MSTFARSVLRGHVRCSLIRVMDASHSFATEGASVTAKPSSSLRVLVVDDDADWREIVENTVTGLGHQCFMADDGATALAMQQIHPVDVILSDWNMRTMTGIELCRLVRSCRPAGNIYFLVITSYTDRAHMLEAFRAGADDYLTKPVNLEELKVRLLRAGKALEARRSWQTR